MSAPKSRDEFQRRFRSNSFLDDTGFSVTQHFPCPACAAADWLVTRLVDLDQFVGQEFVCHECGRGFAFHSPSSGVTSSSYEVVQTCGEDLPPWIPFIQRRK
jgi:transcription elongation factor Elf1